MTNFRLFQIERTCGTQELADDNFKFDENDVKFSKRLEKHCRKTRNCSLCAISAFPTVFSKDLHCKHVKTRGLRKGFYVSATEVF